MQSRRHFLASSTLTLSYLALGRAWAATPQDLAAIGQQIDDILGFDPAECSEYSGDEVVGNCYRKLVKPDLADPTRIVGDLAQSWDVSPDGQTLTFHLREDARFDSGNPVTSEDAAFSLQRLILLNKPPAFLLGQFGFTADNVAKLIRATDTRTLVLQLPTVQATSFVLFCLTPGAGCIVEKAAALAHETAGDFGNGWLKTHSAGAGPYRLVSWAASDHVIVEANAHHSPPPNVGRIVVRHINDAAAQFLALQKGDIDIARNLSSDQLKTLAGNADYRIAPQPQLSSLYIAMNQKVPDLARPGVQQAIKWAIDYDAIARNITPMTWTVGQSFLPNGLSGALPDQPFHKDVARAKELLAKAGVPNGFTVAMDYQAASPYAEIAQAIQQDLKAIGITVELVPGERKQVVTKTRARAHQLSLLVWGSDYYDPNSNAQAFCANSDDSESAAIKSVAWRSHFVDAELTREAEEAAKEIDAAKRVARYHAMQQQFWDRAPFALLLQQNTVAVLRKGVSGLVVGSLPYYTLYGQIQKS